MRAAYAVEVGRVGRRGVLGGLLGGVAELGLMVLKWAVIGTVVAAILMVAGMVWLGRLLVGRVRGESPVRWVRDEGGYWRPAARR